jgi:hypothetical protein
MNLTVPIPNDPGERLSNGGADLARRALAAFALEEYNSERSSLPGLRRLPGCEKRASVDGFLNTRGIYQPCAPYDIEQDIPDLHPMGL